MKSSSSKTLNGHGYLYKEVRFSPSATPIRRAQSVATSDPLLDPVYAATIGARAADADVYNQFNTYAEQARVVLDSHRANFDRERTIFEEERKLWDRERALLKVRIAELESALKGEAGKPGISVVGSVAPNFSWQQISFSGQSSRTGASNSYHVWEGSSPGPKPTRVFPDESKKVDFHLAPLEENGFGLPPSLDAALSPRSRAVDRSAGGSVPVPIEKLDSKLDGITLKSTALPPDVVAQVMTPPSASPSGGSAPDGPNPEDRRSSPERKKALKLKLSDLGPPDVNLTRNAGHTPMVVIGTETDVSQRSPNEEMPYEENPLEPVSTVRLPAERSDSYFPVVEDDPALNGPLSLQNSEDKDSGFLEELDQKLLDEARKVVFNSSDPPAEVEEDGEQPGEGEQEPELKLKSATNFGTAFGSPECGRV